MQKSHFLKQMAALFWRRYHRIPCSVIVGCMSTIVIAQTPPSEISEELDPCVHYSPSEERVDFYIDMRLEQKLVPMSVPKIFLEDGWDHVDGARHGSQLFSVTVDTFEPVSRRQASLQNRQGIHNRMSFLVGDKIEAEGLAAVDLWGADPGVQDAQFEDYTLEPSDHGLLRAVPLGTDPQRNVYFTLDENGAPEVIISCGMQGKSNFPGCSHRFRASGMDIKAYYRVAELPNWPMIQANISQFLQCATTYYNQEDI